MSSTDMRYVNVSSLTLTPCSAYTPPHPGAPLRAGARCARCARRSGACLRAGARPARGARGGGDGPLRGRALVSGPRPCGVAECGVRRGERR
jgi:hypothetical protein